LAKHVFRAIILRFGVNTRSGYQIPEKTKTPRMSVMPEADARTRPISMTRERRVFLPVRLVSRWV
jgi:hypothetical protein